MYFTARVTEPQESEIVIIATSSQAKHVAGIRLAKLGSKDFIDSTARVEDSRFWVSNGRQTI